jgi:signal transduction histidine kinase
MFARGIAHELKGPLSTIKACAEGLLNRLEKQKMDQDIFKEYLSIINDETNRCAFITDNLLIGMQNGDPYESQEINVNESLNHVIKMLKEQGRCRELQIVKNFDFNLPEVLGTNYEILQIFLSIIVNAIDAMKGQGVLTIETRSHMDSVYISINNTGEPITADNIEKIFLPFYTTKAMQGGTGLGLYLAKSFIKDIGGAIKVVSDDIYGTTFTIQIPSCC